MSGPNPLTRLRIRLRRLFVRPSPRREALAVETPLRAPLLSAEQMRHAGAELATRHSLAPRAGPDRLLGRLVDNQKVISRAVRLLEQAVQAQHHLTPAGEWLIDNIHLIEEQIRLAQRHLPKGYSRELPQLGEGPSRGLPRVYDIALTAISHGDGRIDAEGLSGLMSAYQGITPLCLGELWAVPIMLRLALIENLRRVSARVIVDRIDRNLAGEWADRMIEAAEREPKRLVLVIADMVRSGPPMANSFVAELVRRLQGRSAALAMPLAWIEQWLGDAGHNTEQMVQAENQQQAGDQVSVSNAIGSIRLLSMLDWRDFVESISAVEQCLRQDPPGIYSRMDFATRDSYRHAVERLARHGRRPEEEVARTAVGLARARAELAGLDDVQAHVGFYLVDIGLRELQHAVAPRRRPLTYFKDSSRAAPLLLYLLPFSLIAALCSYGLLVSASGAFLGTGLLCLVLGLGMLAFSELGIALVNWAATSLVLPRTLPRLDFSHGIPPSARTMVVVPTMFGSLDGLQALVDALEIRFLANRDDGLHFALLTDFFDADAATLPQDAGLLASAREQIDALNTRHGADAHNRFFLFHRPRLWNPGERRFMGFERKRGKLAALNRLLRGGKGDDFLLVAGNTDALGHIHHVITLDTDTQLPRDAGRKLAGTLAHPLNRARFDQRRTLVTRGYGILQPRVGSSMGGQRRSRYARIFGSEPGIDPYTRAVSDVYQDLFLEGSFIGKGIYDIDAFEHALGGRLPDNSVLSHDLLEGCFARAGLVSDVQLYEDYPARYDVDVKRRHRWIRGDWQLLPWLLPWITRRDGQRERNPLSMLSRGKVLDNLRRSLVPAAMTILLPLGWLLLPQPLVWTLCLLAVLFVPSLVSSLVDLLNKPGELALPVHLRQASSACLANARRPAVTLACLPFEAWFSLDAITRTLWRLLRRRRLLQWAPSSEVERTARGGLLASLRLMWFAPALAIGIGVALSLLNPGALLVAAPILFLWAGSPLLMGWLGTPQLRATADLSVDQRAFLGRLARRIWMFFETHVGPDDNWLPPDNMQEHPVPVVAHRTSPTNIGLALLANLSAHDFGYLSQGGMLTRTAATLATLGSMSRHQGHFYNWYDTRSLQPLPPRYISAVDSGNLAGHLATLRQGLLAMPDQPVFSPRTFHGLADTLGVLAESLQQDQGAIIALESTTLQAALAHPPSTLASAHAALHGIAADAARLAVSAEASGGHAADWAKALLVQCAQAQQDLLALAPWLAGGGPAPAHPRMERIPTLRELTGCATREEGREQAGIAALADAAQARMQEIQRLADAAADCGRMQFDFLYDRARQLLAIGYDVEDRRLEGGYYDLLASEARLGSFVAIAQGQIPQDSWFALGRMLTELEGDPALLSWSGSMFEYLMPQLVMPNYEDTLLDQTARAAVERQIAYGHQRGVPWGISESGYNTVDAQMNYQYRAFGVPGLGLQRGLSEDLVIAPYASMLALMVAPEAACANLQRMSEAGFAGRFGLYEAIDFSAARLPHRQKHAVVRSFMAHHQGMGLLAISHLLHDQPMQRRFAADPEFQATLLLLQERVPRTGFFHPHEGEVASELGAAEPAATQLRIYRAGTSRPEVQMLSNGRYHVLVTSGGGGSSRLRDMAVTRWREDGTRDQWGNFCYVRDVASGDFWSTAHQPTGVVVEGYEAIFSDAKAEFRGRRRDLEMHGEIAVSAEDDIELRRLLLCNRSRRPRLVEITTYAEVVLASAISDEMHPAFSNLFVQTELMPDKQALLCTRRARAHDEVPPWMFHLMAVHDADITEISYETDRARFIGRGNSPARPQALTATERLSNSQGSVLDPIVAVRCRLLLAPDQTATIDMVFGIGNGREDCRRLIDKYRDRHLCDRVFDMAWTHSQVVRRQINASQGDAQLYERLAGLVLFAHPAMRADPAILLRNQRGQSDLWGHAISGDLPIVLVKISDAANVELVRQMVQAHAYWRLKGLLVDLVIWNEDKAGYRQQLQDQIMGLVAAGMEAHLFDRPGGIFVRPAQQISQEDRILLQSVARVIVSDQDGSLLDQVDRRPVAEASMPMLTPPPAAPQHETGPGGGWEASTPALLFDNGLGGFSADGGEYVIRIRPGRTTPAPWSNVLANPQFGCVLSESACGYTWAENAHEFRLTPWHNDPVGDGSGEAFYLRDEDSGRIWSPTPLPCRGEGDYLTRHGFGYSVFEHVEDGIASELCVYVAQEDALKFSVLTLRNLSGRSRRLSLTGYVEWVLGDLRTRTQMHVVTEMDAGSGMIAARNAYNREFPGRVAFFEADDGETTPVHATGKPRRSITGDRSEFIGRNGSLAEPEALRRQRLSGRLGAGLDPCAAIQLAITLEPGAAFETVFRLGLAEDHAAALALARRHRGRAAARQELEAVRAFWTQTLGAVQVQTPDPAVNLLANGWLLYQTIACRHFARSGYYQSGGAYGFRDQLQDGMAMLHAQPGIARAHLLRCAARQFPEGDVQHWWHPPQDRGVRTRCADDFLWLPQAVCRYVEVTGDQAVLDARASYIEGRALHPGEASLFDLPWPSARFETLYQHCVLALQRGMALLGERGLPLIAGGDWNDGMDRVGEGGKGESVWLGFFLYDVLGRFALLADARQDADFATCCRQAAEALRGNLAQHAWDGAWYRRAWFDDGTPLGSAESAECRIDSIAQSWSVLSAAGDPARVRQAMDSLDRHLVRRDAGLVQLLHPPFDRIDKDPGYIRGYVPGVRENGGQYTHAAIWAAMAFAALGDRERAWDLLRMINPLNHALDAQQAEVYKVEPYVIAADVYAVSPHVGRGGWTWYTGSAGWMYRLITESLLGLQRRADRLSLQPCLPADWPGFSLRYRYGDTGYRIEVRQEVGVQPSLQVDGQTMPGMQVSLVDDGVEHQVLLLLATPESVPAAG